MRAFQKIMYLHTQNKEMGQRLEINNTINFLQLAMSQYHF